MAKNLYTTRWEDGALLRYNGLNWSVVGTYVPSDWTTANHYRPSHGCFVYRGKLYTRRCSDAHTMTIDQVDPITGAQIDSKSLDLNALSSGAWNNTVFFGPVFYYKGQVQWFCMIQDLHYVFVATVKDDGSGGIQFTFREVDEFGASTEGQQADSDSNPLVTMIRPVACCDRLYLAGNGSAGADNGWILASDQIGILDMDKSSGIFTFTSLIDVHPDQRSLQVGNNQDSGDWMVTTNYLYNSTIGFGVFKGNPIAVSLCGQVYSIDVVNNTRTEIWDYTTIADYQVSGSTFTTTDDTTGSSPTVHMSSGNQLFYPWNLLSKVTITNFDGSSGNTKIGFATDVDGNGMNLIDATTGDTMDGQAAGTVFDVRFSMLSPVNDSEDQFSYQGIYGVEYNSKFYMILGNGRGQSTTSQGSDGYSRTPPFLMTQYDGVNPATHTRYTNEGNGFNSLGWAFTPDLDNGIINMFQLNHQTQSVVHYTFDITKNPPTLAEVGDIYSRDSSNDNWRNGLLFDGIAAFDAGDITVHIDSTSFNQSASTATVSYKLFGVNADTATMRVEYNVGAGWVAATSKTGQGDGKTGIVSSSSGTSHTFVHDIAVNLTSSFTGNIQYRLSVASQTRN